MLISYYIVTQIKRVTTFLKIRSWTTTVHLQKFFWQRKTIGHQQVLLVSHLTYCLQLPVLYLRRLSRPKYHKFSLKLLIFPMLQYQDFNCKAVTKLFYLPIIQLMDYNGTIARLTADNKVVYQQLRQEMWLASDNSWAWHRLKHLRWRTLWIILCKRGREMPVSCKISWADRSFLAYHPGWAQGPPLLCNKCSTAAWLPDNCTSLADFLQQTVDASKFPTIVGQFTQQPSCATLLWQIEIFN